MTKYIGIFTFKEEKIMDGHGKDQNRKENQVNFPIPPQHQEQQPGIEALMKPKPIVENPDYKGAGKLLNKVAIITGGDSGIGAATAIAFAKEGDRKSTRLNSSHVSISYAVFCLKKKI